MTNKRTNLYKCESSRILINELLFSLLNCEWLGIQAYKLWINYESDNHKLWINYESDKHKLWINYESDKHKLWINYESDKHKLWISESDGGTSGRCHSCTEESRRVRTQPSSQCPGCHVRRRSTFHGRSASAADSIRHALSSAPHSRLHWWTHGEL